MTQQERTSTALEPVAFPTRVDRWLAVVLGISVLASLMATFLLIRIDPLTGSIVLAVVGGVTALVVALSVPTVYMITENELIIRFGVLHTRIPLGSIERVYPTRNPLSAPAWSLDRLGVYYRTGRRRRLALISPARRAEFLAVLRERAGLESSGSELHAGADHSVVQP